MNGVIEALHIFDELNSPILSHTYTSRPLSPSYLLPLYLEHPAPRPNLICLPNTNPPTLVFSLKHANLLFLLTTSSEVEPLLVLEFLHRIVDSFEEFLGTPLLAHKIESNYDVVAQLLTEMCDAGTINTTEPNALRDLVEVEGFMGKLLGNLNLPSKPTFSNPSPASLLAQQNTLALPWRRNNVRHTQNELYADVIETLSVTLAPSGRPLAAFAHGTIAFTSKVSGVPDIVVTLTGPTGKHNLGSIIDLPVFHPCVRLAKWREQPGVLSFIPPDGRFTLAGYEVDLLPLGARNIGNMSASANNLKLPVSLEIKTCLGPTGSDFEVRLTVNRIPGTGGGGGGGGTGSGSSNYPLSSASGVGRGMGGGPQPGTPAFPTLQDLKVTVPLPADVRNLAEIRTAKGDATYNPGDRFLEWTILNNDVATGFASHFALRCTVVGQSSAGDDEDDNDDPTGFGFNTSSVGGRDWSYDAGEPAPYQSASDLLSGSSGKQPLTAEQEKEEKDRKDGKLAQQNKILMPSSASVSFAVKGWTASGIKVESILLDPRRSKGLAETVRPFKGVKYLTVSKGGVEIRC